MNVEGLRHSKSRWREGSSEPCPVIKEMCQFGESVAIGRKQVRSSEYDASYKCDRVVNDDY